MRGTTRRGPRLADGVKLAGRMEGAGYRTPQWLVERNGRYLQVTELVYRVAERLDGRHTLEEIAAAVSDTLGRPVSADNISYLLSARLAPAGLVAEAEGPAPSGPPPAESRSPRSALAVNLRVVFLDAGKIDRAARVLRFLYAPPLLGLVLLLVAGSHWWLYAFQDLSGAVQEVAHRPALVLALFLLLLLSGGFHELGHAAALRYGGARPRGMGLGLYLIYPVFYTDVTDNYRLGRGPRVRTDLGGVYFNLVFTLALTALYAATGHRFLLLAVVLIDIEAVHQLLPFVRLDGYWVLVDATGVPDFFSLMGPFLRSLIRLPGWTGSRLPELRWWAKGVFLAYLLVMIPALALLLFAAVRGAPVAMVAAWGSLKDQTATLAAAWAGGDLAGVGVATLQMVSLALSIFGLLFTTFLLVQVAVRTLWRWGRPSSAGRWLAVAAMIAALALLALLWLPRVSPDLGLSGPRGRLTPLGLLAAGWTGNGMEIIHPLVA